MNKIDRSRVGVGTEGQKIVFSGQTHTIVAPLAGYAVIEFSYVIMLNLKS